jgi:hypothetical protein|tara:strand:- start:2110 stop:2664 length:555 start_codon:yes stop_codon:yes gene_type:complete
LTCTRSRIDAIEDVSEDLFDEWRSETEQITNARSRTSSTRQLQASERKYAALIKAMRRAEASMDPVLTSFRDHVLALKHNLNAQAHCSERPRASDNIQTSLIHSLVARDILPPSGFVREMLIKWASGRNRETERSYARNIHYVQNQLTNTREEFGFDSVPRTFEPFRRCHLFIHAARQPKRSHG